MKHPLSLHLHLTPTPLLAAILSLHLHLTPTPLSAAPSADETPDLTALLKARYEADMKTASGRAWWHGRRVSSVSDPSNMVIITVYEDGKTFRDKAKVTRPVDAARAANAKLKRTVDGKGIPTKLAEARKRREDERNAVSNVTVQVTAGKE